MKFATSVGHLESVGRQADDYLRLRDTDIDWPLAELWVGGALLEGPSELETTPLILMLDAPPEELTWLALHPGGDWICEDLRVTKRPISARYRPTVYPAWNCRDRRVLRFWSSDSGYDDDAVQALRDRQFDRLPIVSPTSAEFESQLQLELELCQQHLNTVMDRYWDRDWRQERKGFGMYPEDHLWRAASAVREIQTALATSGTRKADASVPFLGPLSAQVHDTRHTTEATQLPEIDIEKLRQMCRHSVPDKFKDELRLEVTVRAQRVSIHERRPTWRGEPGEWTSMPIAQLRYEGSGHWTLFFGDRNSRWARYSELPPRQPIDTIIEELEADPTCIFWG